MQAIQRALRKSLISQPCSHALSPARRRPARRRPRHRSARRVGNRNRLPRHRVLRHPRRLGHRVCPQKDARPHRERRHRRAPLYGRRDRRTALPLRKRRAHAPGYLLSETIPDRIRPPGRHPAAQRKSGTRETTADRRLPRLRRPASPIRATRRSAPTAARPCAEKNPDKTPPPRQSARGRRFVFQFPSQNNRSSAIGILLPPQRPQPNSDRLCQISTCRFLRRAVIKYPIRPKKGFILLACGEEADAFG